MPAAAAAALLVAVPVLVLVLVPLLVLLVLRFGEKALFRIDSNSVLLTRNFTVMIEYYSAVRFEGPWFCPTKMDQISDLTVYIRTAL